MTDSGAIPDLRHRAAGLSALAVGFTLLAVLMLIIGIWSLATGRARRQSSSALLPLNVDFSPPAAAVLVAAVALVAATFVGIAALETAGAMRVLARDRRKPHELPAHLRQARQWVLGPLAGGALDISQIPDWPPTAVPEPGRLAPGTRLRCTVLVPAHNEEAVLGITLDSLAAQTRRPNTVLVVADNCTDATVEIARRHGVEVVETVDNTEKKAGALNQELARILPEAEHQDVVMVMDADSTISPEFLEVALGMLAADPDLMAVGGLFFGEDGGGLIGQLQRNEYARYQRVVARRLNRVFVLTGTASVMRTYALRAVAETRGSLLPGTPGRVYDTLALTEDNELTLALKTLGAKLTSPPECRVTTEIMTSWRDLWRQRLRWHRGALENIGLYGLTRATAMYWGQQLSLAYGVIALWSYFALMFITLLAADGIRWSPFWVTIGMVFVLERLVTVWAIGWRGRLLAAPIFIELMYAAYLQACFVTSLLQIVTGRRRAWNYVPRPTVNGVIVAPALVVQGILLPTSLLYTDWYQALCLWVGFNTLVFVVFSVLQMLPPLEKTWSRLRGRGSTPPRPRPAGTP